MSSPLPPRICPPNGGFRYPKTNARALARPTREGIRPRATGGARPSAGSTSSYELHYGSSRLEFRPGRVTCIVRGAVGPGCLPCPSHKPWALSSGSELVRWSSHCSSFVKERKRDVVPSGAARISEHKVSWCLARSVRSALREERKPRTVTRPILSTFKLIFAR